MYNRKSNTYAERKIFPYVTTADLRLDLLERATVFRDYAKIKKITGAVYDKNESVWKL